MRWSEAYGCRLRFAEGPTDAADEQAMRFANSVQSRDPLGNEAGGDIVQLANMRDGVLAGNRFHCHRPEGRDQSIHAIAAPGLPVVTTFRRCAENREVKAHGVRGVGGGW